MRKILALLVALVMVLAMAMPALAEDIGSSEQNPLVVGSLTTLNGAFFTNMWGNNTSDLDVRMLLHAYSPVVWTMQSLFEINATVVENVVVGMLDNGNKMYTIKLHEDLKFSDGSPITAQDYCFSLLLHGSPITEEINGNITSVSHIAGYEEFATGQSEVFAGVAYIDEYTFGIEINSDFLPFFYEMGMLDCLPYPISVIAPGCEIADDGAGSYIRNIQTPQTGANAADAAATAATDATATPGTSEEPIFTAELLMETIFDEDTGYLSNPKVTSGPYQLVEYNRDENTATLAINTHFKGDHAGQKPNIPYIKVVNVVLDTMMEDLETGKVHLLNKVVQGAAIDEGLTLRGEGMAQSDSYPRMGFSFISFACEEGPGQFEAVRQAVAYSLDVEEFTRQYTTLNYGLPVYGYFGIGQWMVQMVLSPGTRPDPETPEDEATWNDLSLDSLNTYAVDAEKAKALLVEDGWTLNEKGEDFKEGEDTLRHKQVDGELMPLTIKFAIADNSASGKLLSDMLTEPLAALGMSLETEDTPFDTLLRRYYRQEDRTYNMMHLATNFMSIFDPYTTFNTDESFDGEVNTTGFHDEKLEQLALDLRQTEPGDLLSYCQKWLTFQQYWNEKLPMIPLYSNVYFDFFAPELQGYYPNSQVSWGAALLYAYIGEPPVVEGAGEAADTPTTFEDGAGGGGDGVAPDDVVEIDG